MNSRNSLLYCIESRRSGRLHYEICSWNDVEKHGTYASDFMFDNQNVPVTEIKNTGARRFYVDTSACLDGWDVIDRRTGERLAAFTKISDAEWFRDEKNATYRLFENT